MVVDPRERLASIVRLAEKARGLLFSGEDSHDAMEIYRQARFANTGDPWEDALWAELRDMILKSAIFLDLPGGRSLMREYDRRLTALRDADIRGSVHYWTAAGLDREAALTAAALHR